MTFLRFFTNHFGQGKLEGSKSWIIDIEKCLYYFLGFYANEVDASLSPFFSWNIKLLN